MKNIQNFIEQNSLLIDKNRKKSFQFIKKSNVFLIKIRVKFFFVKKFCFKSKLVVSICIAYNYNIY